MGAWLYADEFEVVLRTKSPDDPSSPPPPAPPPPPSYSRNPPPCRPPIPVTSPPPPSYSRKTSPAPLPLFYPRKIDLLSSVFLFVHMSHDMTKPTKWLCAQRRLRSSLMPRLIRVFAVRMKKPWVLSYPLSAQRRLWSDWADAQADLNLRWAHTHFVGFVMSWLTCIRHKKQLKCLLIISGEKSDSCINE